MSVQTSEPIGVNDDEVLAALRRDGFWVGRLPVRKKFAVDFVLGVARAVGPIFVPQGCNAERPVIRTAPTRVRDVAPFDRPEPIGWHGDFATYEDRPEVSLVYVTRVDPRGGDFGAWRLASVSKVVEDLRATREGRSAMALFAETKLPFSYSDGESSRWFHVLQRHGRNRIGLRFYAPSIRRGCVAEYGSVPPSIGRALTALERSADRVGQVVPTRPGSLLVASNWLALHDRVRQTASFRRFNREALLCFVSRALRAR